MKTLFMESNILALPLEAMAMENKTGINDGEIVPNFSI